MKIHRFYIGDQHDKRGKLVLEHKIWVHDPTLLNQWIKVLRFRVGEELVLFDGVDEERLYRITVIESTSVGLELVTQLEPKKAGRELYLFWSLLKSDKNDFVLQKCTEIGVTHFVPLVSERNIANNFDENRARRILIEAAEQCGRADIPRVREPMTLQEALSEYGDKVRLCVAEQGAESAPDISPDIQIGLLIGPEGGWSDEEKNLFVEQQLSHLKLGQFTLRAETAAIVGSALLLQ